MFQMALFSMFEPKIKDLFGSLIFRQFDCVVENDLPTKCLEDHIFSELGTVTQI